MGITDSCPCTGKDAGELTKDPAKEQKSKDIVDKLLYGKMTLNNLLYYYDYDRTKVCLIKTKDLADFFNSKNLMRLPNKKEINYYYDKISITNFLDFNETTFLILEYTQKYFEKNSRELKTLEKNSNTLNYIVENVSFSNLNKKDRIATSKNIYETLINDLKTKNKRNFIFNGLVKDLRNRELCLKLTYKKNIRIDIEVFYEIFIFDGKISEESIKYILTESRFKNKLLKSIFSFSPDMLDSKPFLNNYKNPNKNKVLNNLVGEGSKSYSQKCYFFIFEENSHNNNDYDYLIISLDSNKNSNETLLQDIARKLNDYQEDYKLSCVFSDEKKIYLILETSNNEECSLFLNSLNDSNA